MMEQLSHEDSPDLPTAVSEIKTDIWFLNRPKKLFLHSQKYMSSRIRECIVYEGILECSYAAWVSCQKDLASNIFRKLLEDQNEKYRQVISFWLLSIFKRHNKIYEWFDIHFLIESFLDYKFYLNKKMFSKKKVDNKDKKQILTPKRPIFPSISSKSSFQRNPIIY